MNEMWASRLLKSHWEPSLDVLVVCNDHVTVFCLFDQMYMIIYMYVIDKRGHHNDFKYHGV